MPVNCLLRILPDTLSNDQFFRFDLTVGSLSIVCAHDFEAKGWQIRADA